MARDIYNANSQLHKTTEPMLRRNQDQEIVPAVAESWTPGPAAAYWDFLIREDCKWSDGTPLTADDWVFTGQHLCNPDLDTPWVWFYYPIKGIQKRKNNEITGCRSWFRKGRRPHRAHLWRKGLSARDPEPDGLPGCGSRAQAHGREGPRALGRSAEGMVGNGPYRLVEWTHNVRYWWEPNEYYNGIHTPAWKEICGLIGVPDALARLEEPRARPGRYRPGSVCARSAATPS